MKKKLRLAGFFKSVMIVALLGCYQIGFGQVTIAVQDFETPSATPTWGYSGTSSIQSTADRYNGLSSLRIGSSDIVTFDNVDISNYSDVILSVAFASLGVDSGEDLFMDISFDNGNTWTGTGSVKLVDGFSNASININTTNASNPTTVSSNPYPTSIALSETQIRVRFRAVGLDAGEYYYIDDVELTGELSTNPTINTSVTTLTGFTYVVGNGPSASQSFDLSGVNLTGFTADITVTGSANYEVSTDDISFGPSATVSYTSATLSNTPIYVRLKSGLAIADYNGENITISGGGDTDGATVNCSGSVSLSTCFTDNNNFEKVSVVTNTDGDVWSYAAGTYSMNGYNVSSEESNQWLILGDLDLSSYTSGDLIQLVLNANEGFSGTDLKIYATSSYTGCPNDSGNSWLELGTISSSGNNQTFDLSVLHGESSIYLGIQYFDNDGTYSSWSLSNIKIQTDATCFTINTPVVSFCTIPPALATNVTSLSGFSYLHAFGPSVSQSFILSGSNLTGFTAEITVTGSTNYEVSIDNSTFGTSATVSYTSATLSNTPIYVRLKSGLAVGNYNGENITISGGGDVDGASVSCSGSVVPPPPVNDLCSNAIELTVNAGALSGTLVEATITGSASHSDVYYKFTPSVTGIYTITLNNLSVASDKDLYVYASCPANGGSGSSISSGASASTTGEGITDTFNGGTTYYIAVYDFSDLEGTFDIQITADPALLVSAANLNFSAQNVNTSSVSQSFNLSGSFLTPASGDITVTSPSSDFEVSLDDSNWNSSVQVSYTLGELNSTPLYIRFSPQSSCATLSGNVTFSGGGVSVPPTVSVSGNGVLPEPMASSATNILDNSFEANWSAVNGATSYVIDVSSSPTFDVIGATSVTESFESGLSGGYQTTTVTLATGNWDITEVLAGTTGVNSGARSAQLRSIPGSALVSPSFENGVSSISFWVTSSTSSGAVQVNYSIDGGSNWIPTSNSPYTGLTASTVQISANINTEVPTLIQIKRTAATIYIDDVLINTYLSIPSFISGYENLNTGNVLTYTVTGLETGTKYYYRVRAIDGSCASIDSNVIDVTTTGVVKWISPTNTNWSTASNWSNNAVPDGTYDIEIPQGNPVLDTDFTVQPGKNLSITTTGTLTIAPLASLTIQGTTDFGGKLVTLQSDATGTATIGEITGTLSNATNVTIERYIPAKRAWRALTAPLKGSNGSLYDTWQNGGSNLAGVGVEMWGPTGTNLATGANYSVLDYTPTGWVGVNNTATSNLFETTKNNAYLVFVTGAYGNGNITSGASATTLKATGELITGDVSYGSLIDTKHTLIGNPYASPLEPSLILDGATNLIPSFWVWDPALASTGGYVSYDDGLETYSNITGSYTNATAIQSGQAFFVKATPGNTGSFTLSESKKATSVSNVFGKSANQNLNNSLNASILRFGLYKELNQEWKPLDGAIVGFYDTANQVVDDNDGKKFANGGENIAFVRNNITMSSEHFSTPQPLDELYIRVWNTSVNNYKLRINTESFIVPNIEATLMDLFTGTQTPIVLDGTVQEYPFAVTSASTSTGDRFKVVFNATVLGTTTIDTTAINVYPNPATNGMVNVQLPEGDYTNYSYELVNVLGQKVLSNDIETLSGNQFSINTKGLANNWYALRIVNNGKTVYQTKVIIANK